MLVIFDNFVVFSEDEPVQDVFKKEKVLGNWDDEDVEDNDVKDSWEDEEAAPVYIFSFFRSFYFLHWTT